MQNSGFLNSKLIVELFLLMSLSVFVMAMTMNDQYDGASFEQIQFGLLILIVPSIGIAAIWCALSWWLSRMQIDLAVQYGMFLVFLLFAGSLGNWVARAANF